MSLFEKMFNVMNESEAIEKSMEVGTGKNSYKAVSEAAILNMIKPLFKKYKLIIFPVSGDIKDHCMVWDKTDYDGKTAQTIRAITELKVTYRIMDTETNEFQDVVGFGNGSDPQDKGSGKASTYSFKNVLSKTFMLFSGEDTDTDHSDGNKAEPDAPRCTHEQVKELFLEANNKKSKVPGYDFIRTLESMLYEGRITTKFPYADPSKKVINWTIDDYKTIKTELELPF